MEQNNIKQPRKISKKGLIIALGFFFILLVFCLILDIGYVAKTINFIPVFLGGYLSFGIYLILFSFGVYYVFFTRDSFVLFKWYHIISFIICFISLSGILSLGMSKVPYDLNSFSSIYGSYFSSYYNPFDIPFLFRMTNSHVGGGYVGYMVSSLFLSMDIDHGIIYILLTLICVLGLLIGFSAIIKKGVLKARKKKSEHKKAIEEKFANYSFADLEREARIADPESYLDKTQKERDEMDDAMYLDKKEEVEQKEEVKEEVTRHFYEEKPFDDSYRQIRPVFKEENIINENKSTLNASENNIDKIMKMEDRNNMKKVENPKINDFSKQTIKSASKFDNNDYPNPDEKKSLYYQEESKPITFYNPDQERIGGLTKAHYYKEGIALNKEMERGVAKENDTPVIQRPQTVENTQVQSQIEEAPKKAEQLHLDFDKEEEKIVIDENVVSARPTFMDPDAQNTKKVESKPIVSAPVTPKKVRRKWKPIDLDLLYEYDAGEAKEQNEITAKQRMHKINEIFTSFRVQAYCSDYTIGPSVTRYNIECGQGVSVKAVNSVINDLSVRLGGVDARFESLVMGKAYSGLEIPNAMISTVGFKEVLEKLPSRDKKPLAVAFGKDIAGDVIWASLDDFPHMLVSGTTGSGKSIFIHSIIMTLVMRTSPDDLKIVLVDPKQVEMTKYKDMPHLLTPIITEPSDANSVMKKLVDEMDNTRYRLFSETGCSDIKQYNEYCQDHPEYEPLPYIVAVLDEYSDLVDRCKDIAKPVLSIAQKARAAGIHLLICTQRPSANVINGVIKGNLPTHVALMTANSVDSVTIIGEGGAEKLLGKGDMLVQCPLVSRVGCVRLQGCFVQNKEINRVIECIKSNFETIYDPKYLDLSDDTKKEDNPYASPFSGGEKEFHDERYEYVKNIIMGQEYASISKIQREFGFGFSRAGKIFTQLQREGIVDTNGSAKGCKVLVHDESYGVTPDISSIESTTIEKVPADAIMLSDEE